MHTQEYRAFMRMQVAYLPSRLRVQKVCERMTKVIAAKSSGCRFSER